MKIKPVILCGGSGSRLWPKSENTTAKQFIDFGGWTLLQKTLERIKDPVFDYPIISTNLSYLKLVRKYLKKNKIKKFKIILEPFKKNTAAAILSSALLKEVTFDQPMIFFPADHLIQKNQQFKLHQKLVAWLCCQSIALNHEERRQELYFLIYSTELLISL